MGSPGISGKSSSIVISLFTSAEGLGSRETRDDGGSGNTYGEGNRRTNE